MEMGRRPHGGFQRNRIFWSEVEPAGIIGPGRPAIVTPQSIHGQNGRLYMHDIVAPFLNWMDAHPTLLWGAGAVSLFIFLVTLIGLPYLIIRLPADYLTIRRDHSIRRFVAGTVLDLPYRVARQLLGTLLILSGLAMLVLPGQGLLAIVVGLSLIHFPGKQRVIHGIVRQENILKSANWIRARANRPPLLPPDENPGDRQGPR